MINIEYLKNLTKNKLVLSALVVAIITGTITFTIDNPTESKDYEQLAKCLTSKDVKLYGSATCPYTNRQLQTFGNASKYLDYVQCEDRVDECIAVGIKEYPIWMINKIQYPGEQPFEVLSKLAECDL